jgi:hypothetical protein
MPKFGGRKPKTYQTHDINNINIAQMPGFQGTYSLFSR